MGRKRTSVIWKLSSEQFKNLVKNSLTYRQILSSFNLQNKGNNFRTLKRRISEEDIDDSHIRESKIHWAGIKATIPLEEILIENSTYNSDRLKSRLIGVGFLKNICSECGQVPEWNGKPLSLHLDHINGNHNDNRIENLRILCPHCHSQTPNFAGKANRKHFTKPNWRNQDRPKSRKVNRPTKEELTKMTQDMHFTEIGRRFGVSDNAVRKWVKRYGIVGA